jgi:hypothetical protein
MFLDLSPVPAKSNKPSSAPLVIAANLVALALLLPWYRRIDGEAGFLCAALVAVTLSGAMRACYPRVRLVQMICCSFGLMYLGVAATYQLQSGTAAWGDRHVFTQYGPPTSALWFLLLWFVALLVSAEFRARLRPSDTKRIRPTVVLPEVRPLAAWAFLFVCMALAPRAIAVNGGLGGMFSNRAARVQTLASQGISVAQSGGATLALYSILPLALSLAATYLFIVRMIPTVREHGVLAVRGSDALGCIAATGLFVLFGNPFINSRFSSLAAIGSVLLVIWRPRTPRKGFLLSSALILGVGLLYPLLNFFRGTVTSAAQANGNAVYASPDFDGFQQVINGLAYARAVPGWLGHYTISAILFFVPRSHWHAKANPASIDVAAWHGYAFTNLSLPLPAELVIDFGKVGALVIAILLGVLMGNVDRAWVIGASPRTAAMAPYAAFATISLLRGPLGSLAPIYLTILLLLWLGTGKAAAVPNPRTSGASPPRRSRQEPGGATAVTIQ